MKEIRKSGFIIAAIIITIFIFAQQSCTSKNKDNTVSSPDKKISVHFQLSDDMKAYYDIYYSDSLIMQNSRLGIIMENEDFSEKCLCFNGFYRRFFRNILYPG